MFMVLGRMGENLMKYNYVIFGAALCVAGSCLAEIHPDAVQWKLEDGGNGHWYATLYDGPSCWDDAVYLAESYGGHLVTITSEDEQAFIAAELDVSYWNWIGGYQDPNDPGYSEPNGGWKWITGESWNYENWAPGEPNGGSGDNHLNLKFPPDEIAWNDNGACGAGNYIVEWPCNDVDCLGLTPVQWAESDGGNGHWYVVAPHGVAHSWEAAAAWAVSLGGHLATLTDQGENEFVRQLYAEIGDTGSCDSCNSGSAALLGGVLDLNGQWSWVTGEDWSFEDWYSGEPTGGTEDVLYLRCPGQWNDGSNALDAPCRYAPIIEWSADLDGNGIVDFGDLMMDDPCPADVNGDGVVDVIDLLGIIEGWGSCP